MAIEDLKSQRLKFSPFKSDDARELFEFMSDAKSMEHTYVAPSSEHCLHRLNAYEEQRSKFGFAPWVVRSSESGPIIGWGGLCLDTEEPSWGLEVIYAFTPGSWGQGYATELVQYSLNFAFLQLAAPEVHAFAKPANVQSVKVLQKAGFGMLRYEQALERNHYIVRASAA